jgi:hypothetical protein
MSLAAAIVLGGASPLRGGFTMKNVRAAMFGGLAVAVLALIPASAALASPSGGHPTPTPTVTQLPVTPVVHPLKAEQFSVQISGIGSVTTNDVEATGPVAITAGTDAEQTATRGEFTTGTSDVIVRHAALGAVHVDLAACDVTVDQHAAWQFAGGAGTFAGAAGAGWYDLTAMFAFNQVTKYRNVQVCPLQHLSVRQVLAAVGNDNPHLAPSFYDIAVHGTGVARA